MSLLTKYMKEVLNGKFNKVTIKNRFLSDICYENYSLRLLYIIRIIINYYFRANFQSENKWLIFI